MTIQQPLWTERLTSPEAVAIRALGFMANRRREMDEFLAKTGLSRADLKRRPAEPEHLAAVLDFLIAHESMLLDFSRAVDLPPEAAYEARRLFGHVPSGRGWPPYLGRPAASALV
jgi:hypothetical protein